MATTKKATKKTTTKRAPAVKKARKVAGTGTAAQGKEKKKSARTFSEQRLKSLLNKLLLQYEDQVDDGEVKVTNGDGIRLIQLRESLGLVKPTSVKVEWVEPKKS